MIDTHSHVYKEYYDNIEEIINNMNGNIIISGTNDKNNIEILELCKNYDNVFGTLGIHPEDVDNVTDESFELIEKHINDNKIVAIGEIGLDYHYTTDNKEKQKEIFIKQLDLARKYNKPVVIHIRDSMNDTIEIIKNYKELKKDIHCYSGSLESAKELIKMNCKLGIGGVLTFKNGKKLQEVVKNIDLEYLLLETDSPYLSPEPFRGKKNEPNNVIYVAKKIAEIKGINVEEVLLKTTNNAIYQFDLDKYLC
ncbi:MAG: TatD family deoxyribonuclease [Firmicutes bacterium]|nr:TatD family deoxyribonuclease [Bacillota bacterium]